MKKKLIFVFILFFIAIILGISFIFYKDDGTTIRKQKNDVCFLIGNTKNVKQIDSSILKDEVLQAMENKSNYSVIVIDGNPNEISFSGKLKKSNRLLTNNDNNQTILNNHMEEIVSCKPNDEEIDILSALNYASKSIDKEADNKKIVIYSSGISTAGDLNFAENPDLIYDNPNEIVEYLKTRHALPDLSNVEIIWYGLNHVEGEQSELGTFELYKLKCIWLQILKECGIKFENMSDVFDEKPSQNIQSEEIINKSDFPKVSSADFKYVIFPIEVFSFEINSSVLKNRDKAIEILKPIAQDIINAGCPQFYIVGSTVSDLKYSKKECLKLSLDRAQTIKEIVCDLGVPENCLKTYGIGREYIDDDNSWRVNDLNPNGTLNHSLAPQNRKVMLISSDSTNGKSFIEDYYKFFKDE